MLNMEAWMDIKSLRSEGHSIRQIAEITGHSRNTIRKVIRQKSQQPFQKPTRGSQLDPFKTYINQRYNECALSSVRLLEEIRPMGYTGSIITLRRYVHTLKPGAKSLQKATVRFETPPGRQAQADWAYCGKQKDGDGNSIPIYAFVMVLSFSRMMYIEFTSSMKIDALIRCHINAFSYFGGWPAEILYDNMKQVKLSREQWNPLFIDFANHYGITVKTHRIRRPRTKGKVERMVYYVKDNFLNGRVFAGMEDLHAQARQWLDTEANVRVHATTKERPVDQWEKENLSSLLTTPVYQLNQKTSRKINHEGFVHFNRSRYSAPPEHVGKTILVEQDGQRVVLRLDDMIIADHKAARSPDSLVIDKQHVEDMWKLSLNRSAPPEPKWLMAAEEMIATVPLTLYEEVAL